MVRPWKNRRNTPKISRMFRVSFLIVTFLFPSLGRRVMSRVKKNPKLPLIVTPLRTEILPVTVTNSFTMKRLMFARSRRNLALPRLLARLVLVDRQLIMLRLMDVKKFARFKSSRRRNSKIVLRYSGMERLAR